MIAFMQNLLGPAWPVVWTLVKIIAIVAIVIFIGFTPRIR